MASLIFEFLPADSQVYFLLFNSLHNPFCNSLHIYFLHAFEMPFRTFIIPNFAAWPAAKMVDFKNVISL